MVTAKRARLLSAALLLIMFVAGALAGAATLHVVADEERLPRGRGARGPDALFERLQLTPEQRAQAELIMEQGRADMEAFWVEHGPTLRAITDSTRQRVRALLTAEQRALEDELLKKRAEFGEHEGDRPRGGRDGRRQYQ